ncbi:MAG: S9 family peptidase, partial [Pedobacter sp.]
MMQKLFVACIFTTMIACNSSKEKNSTVVTWPAAKAPVAEIKPFTRILHGDSVVDNYNWMVDYFKKGPDSTKVVDYLNAENAYLDTMMSATKKFQADLFTEMKARIKEKDESVPYLKNGYYYYSRTEDGQQYYKMCRKKGSLTAPEEVMLDVDRLARGKAYYAIGGYAVSPDNNLLAYAVDEVSRRQYTVHVKNLATGEVLTDAITNTSGEATWAADNKTIFYTANNPVTLLSEKIKRHVIGTPATADVTVYEEKDKTNYIGVSKSKNDQYIFIYSGGTLASDMRMIKASEPTAEFKLFQPRMKEVLYEVTPLADKFIIRTNLNAKNFKLMECPLDQTDSAHWKDLIPHRTDVLVQGVEEFANYLVVNERKNGLVTMRIRNLADNQEHYVDFGEAAYAANFASNSEYNTKTLRYSYTSLTTPASIYDYDMATKAKS